MNDCYEYSDLFLLFFCWQLIIFVKTEIVYWKFVV